MSGVKDPFEILADEITLIRRQIDQLQRTSLDRDEAEHLNATIAQSLFSDVLDKAIIFALAYVIVRSLPRRILDRYPFTGHSLSRRARAADQR